MQKISPTIALGHIAADADFNFYVTSNSAKYSQLVKIPTSPTIRPLFSIDCFLKGYPMLLTHQPAKSVALKKEKLRAVSFFDIGKHPFKVDFA